jgi:hypothetical protein
MAISALYENTATISTTEVSLPNNTTYAAGSVKTDDLVFQCFIDVSNMAAGDQFRVRVLEKARSGDTVRIIEEWILTGAQSKPLFVLPSFIFMYGWDVTMTKLAGTDRAMYWSIRSVA